MLYILNWHVQAMIDWSNGAIDVQSMSGKVDQQTDTRIFEKQF